MLPNRRYLPGTNELLWLKAAGPADKSYRSGLGPVTTSVSIDPWLKPSPAQTLTTLLGIPVSGDFGVVNGGFSSNSLIDLPSDVNLTPQTKIVVTSPANFTNWTATVKTSTCRRGQGRWRRRA